MHVVLFLAKGEETAVDDHVVTPDLSSVATSGGRCVWCIDLDPFVGFEVEFPEVVHSYVAVFATENVHIVAVDTCSMTCSWSW